MKKTRIYLDTSVIGGCFDPEFEKWSNGLFRDFHVGTLLPVISNIVDAELDDAPPHVRDKYAELLALDPEFVLLNQEASDLADYYLEDKIVSKNFVDDALHIAIATVSLVDMLVSWNFKHILNYRKMRQFNAVNMRNGYNPLQIHSPREVTSYGD